MGTVRPCPPGPLVHRAVARTATTSGRGAAPDHRPRGQLAAAPTARHDHPEGRPVPGVIEPTGRVPPVRPVPEPTEPTALPPTARGGPAPTAPPAPPGRAATGPSARRATAGAALPAKEPAVPPVPVPVAPAVRLPPGVRVAPQETARRVQAATGPAPGLPAARPTRPPARSAGTGAASPGAAAGSSAPPTGSPGTPVPARHHRRAVMTTGGWTRAPSPPALRRSAPPSAPAGVVPAVARPCLRTSPPTSPGPGRPAGPPAGRLSSKRPRWPTTPSASPMPAASSSPWPRLRRACRRCVSCSASPPTAWAAGARP
jgi:hypothetical protein